MRTRVAIGTALTVALALLILVPTGPFGNASATSPVAQASPAPSDATAVGLNISATPTATLSPLFWGTTVSARARLLSDEADIVNSSGAKVVVFPGGNAGDEYDPFNNTLYVPLYSPTVDLNSHPSTNESQFVAWCESINCTAILQLPAEINNASLAASVVNYTEKTLGFHPAYWIIGNEPSLWTRWNVSWSEWSQSHKHTVTQLAYAEMVNRYTTAIHSYADPNAKIIGLAGQDAIDLDTWVNETVWIDGPNITGIAYHDYPVIRLSPTTGLSALYGDLQSNRSLTFHVTQTKGDISNAMNLTNYTSRCPVVAPGPTCSPISVFVTEFGSGLTRQWSGPYSRTFPGGVSLAAQTVQAMDVNLTNLDVFATSLGTSNSWLHLNGTARPDYLVYAEMLRRLGNEVYTVGFNNSLHASLYAVGTIDPTDHNRSDLLLVNTNLTRGARLVPQLPGVGSDAAEELWIWSGTVVNGTIFNGACGSQAPQCVLPTTAGPVAEYFPNGVPLNWTLPAQSVALFEAYPSRGAPIGFVESGANTTAGWFVTVDGKEYAAVNATSLTVFVTLGFHSISIPALSPTTYLQGSSYRGYERIFASAVQGVTVGFLGVGVGIHYAEQWQIDLNVSSGGSVSPDVAWANESQPLTLTATPDPGWIFDRWFGWGIGNVTNSTDPTIVITPTTTHINERATFVQSYGLSFEETGLPHGTTWGVGIRGSLTSNQSTNTSRQVITFDAANGTWGYTVYAPRGYRAYPPAGSINVTGAANGTIIEFAPYTPPPPTYPVQFMETGLPTGTSWNVTIRGNNTYSSNGAASITTLESNGTYGFSVGYVNGWHAVPLRDSFVVSGAATTAPSITFTLNHTRGPVTYPAIWKEKGLRVNWTVLVSNATSSWTAASNGTWVTDYLPNGTYSYLVPLPTINGFTVTNATGVFTIDGTGFTQALTFSPPESPFVFTEVGLPNGTQWSVRLGNITINSTASWIAFNVIGGPQYPMTYTYGVPAIGRYIPTPHNGTVTVGNNLREGAAIAFTPPTSPITPWTLIAKALFVVGGGLVGIIATFALASWIRRRFRARRICPECHGTHAADDECAVAQPYAHASQGGKGPQS
jgi:Divergent InlB B-repeat domain